MRVLLIMLFVALTLPFGGGVHAQSGAKSFPPSTSGLPIPRFVSLKGEPVNMRAGPGVRYPIRWVYVRRNLPLMVTAEFEFWRRVRDVDGAEGWIHKSLLRGRRMAIVTADGQMLRVEPRADAPPAAEAERGVIAELVACQGEWCRVEAGEVSGWLPRSAIFGALPDESFER